MSEKEEPMADQPTDAPAHHQCADGHPIDYGPAGWEIQAADDDAEDIPVWNLVYCPWCGDRLDQRTAALVSDEEWELRTSREAFVWAMNDSRDWHVGAQTMTDATAMTAFATLSLAAATRALAIAASWQTVTVVDHGR